MGEIASPGQLRMSFVRWALVTVPLVVFLGFLAGRVSSPDNRWYAALRKPAAMPPPWAFPVAWTVLYILLGVAIAMVLHARGARWRGIAIALFAVSLALNLAWSPLFFAAHQVLAAFALILGMFAFAVATAFAFGRVRSAAAWLMVPYLVWLSFAAILNWQTHRLNPDAEELVPRHGATQITL
ncbi:MAG: tryptophan-rich sensory protein [Sphingomonadaceae bacterium]|nr:tryptophan-rich sensory protein [Sphingomonadaceae bacterium]